MSDYKIEKFDNITINDMIQLLQECVAHGWGDAPIYLNNKNQPIKLVEFEYPYLIVSPFLSVDYRWNEVQKDGFPKQGYPCLLKRKDYVGNYYITEVSIEYIGDVPRWVESHTLANFSPLDSDQWKDLL